MLPKQPRAPSDLAARAVYAGAGAAAVPLAPTRLRASSAGGAALLSVALLAALLPVYRVYEQSTGRINLCPADALMPVLLIAYRGYWLRSGSLGWWLLALWLVNLLSWSASVSVLTPLTLVFQVLKVLTCYGYALVGCAIGQDRRSESLLVKALAFVTIPIAAAGVSTYFTGQPQFLMKNFRVVGTFNDPNGYAVYLAMLFPIIAALPAGWLMAPVLVGGAIVSLSRTGLVAMALSLLLSLTHVPLRRYLPLLAVCAAALIVVYGGAQNVSTTKRIFSYQESMAERQALWALGYEVASEHPLLGTGKGNWEQVVLQKTIPHNTFLQVAADVGFLGLAVFFLPIFLRLWAGLRRPEARLWAVALCVALAGGMAVSFDNFRPFWLFVGLLSGKLLLRPELHAPWPVIAPPRPARATWFRHMPREST